MSSNPVSVDAAQFRPVTLEGRIVRLEPLRLEHAAIFWELAKDSAEEMFRWFAWAMTTPEALREYVDRVLEEQRRGVSVGFATVERESGKVIGGTRFMTIEAANRKLEVGSTWIAPPWQRTAVNTEAKYLMLRHAFEIWKCVRVELRSDALNQKSRRAILRIGAKEEGTLRKHMFVWNGRQRDTVYFSILDTEWPEVKARLEERLLRS
jgi:RimJ/RimL family protein N-acetyltransferase